jgi:hypothetical protein
LFYARGGLIALMFGWELPIARFRAEVVEESAPWRQYAVSFDSYFEAGFDCGGYVCGRCVLWVTT